MLTFTVVLISLICSPIAKNCKPEIQQDRKILYYCKMSPNLEVANLINKLLIDLPSSKWNERTVLYVVTDNSFEFPPYSIISSKLIALE